MNEKCETKKIEVPTMIFFFFPEIGLTLKKKSLIYER